MMSNINKATDIRIRYGAKEFKYLENLFDLDIHTMSFILALMGYKYGECLPLSSNDNSGEEHTFSRTNYSRYTTEYDAYFGLLTILDNLDKNYDDVVNKMAFSKTERTGESFTSLINVKTFYGYLLSGIKHLYDKVTQYGKDEVDVFDAIYEMLTDDDELLDIVINELLIDEGELSD